MECCRGREGARPRALRAWCRPGRRNLVRGPQCVESKTSDREDAIPPCPCAIVHDLIPLMVTPSITSFCANRKIRITGSTAMLIAAITTDRLPEAM